MTANAFVRVTFRLENQSDPTNSGAFHNVLDRKNHIFRIICGEKSLDPNAKFAIKQWLKQENRDHVSVMRGNEGVFFVNFTCQAKPL